MKNWQWKLFGWLAKKIVRQGGQHRKIAHAYSILRKAAISEYHQDAPGATDAFLEDLFKDARTQ